MKIKKALLKNSIKEIKVTYKRFISIMLMALLGVGFFSGLRAASPDMVDSIDSYYKNQNVYDIQIISTLGLTNQDIEALKNVKNVGEVYGTYSQDGLIKDGEKETVAKILTLDDVNKPVLIEGAMPQNATECLVEENFLKNNNKKIGDTIQIESKLETTIDENQNEEEANQPEANQTEGETTQGETTQENQPETEQTNNEEENTDQTTENYLKNNTLKIVGTVQSPLYISRERGTSKLGSGQINEYIYVTKENINTDIYTEIYIKLQDSNKYQTGSNSYEKYVEETKNGIEEIKEERQKARYDELINEANQKIAEAEEEFNTEKQNGESQIAEAEEKIATAKTEISNAEKEIAQNESQLNSKITSGKNQINTAKQTISESEAEYNSNKQTLDTVFKEAENQKATIQENIEKTTQGIEQVNSNLAQTEEKLKLEEITEEEKAVLEQTKQELTTKKAELEQTKTTLEQNLATLSAKVTEGKKQLEEAKSKIDSAKTQIATQEKTLTQEEKNARAQISSAKQKLEESKQEVAQAEAELEESRAEFNEKIAEAEGKLIDAKEEVSKIENPVWYILDRNQNSGYSSYIQDTKSIENLSLVFPVVFFAIAILVSLTSMTRMVEEQRQEIGTLKALGYNKFHISIKYIIYSSLACIIGGIIGMNIGFQLLPRIIWDMYEMMYTLPEFLVQFDYANATLGLVLIYICIVGATLYSILRELRHMPAILLRPKAPKLGKRVLLEKIPFIWKRLNFSHKVTIRNIFRYKKRFLMTIIGIFGCTSLILAGFGLKDSISKILPYQYEKVFDYDLQVALKSSLTEEQKENVKQNLQNNNKIKEVVESYMLSGTAANKESQEDVQIVIPESNKEVKKVINLKNLETEEEITMPNDGVIITDKLSQLLGVKVGDTITIKDSNDVEKEVKISSIAENYISHYVYMSKEYYENLYQEKYNTNVMFVKDDNLTEEEEQEISRNLISMNEVSTVQLTKTIMKTLDDTLNSLNYVVIILIISAGLLAFVVLYNLSNVNISERIRELATIKVLGFYDREVYSYVTRETILLTLIGIVLGLGGGYFLNFYIIGTCEIDMLRFVKVIDPLSYLYAILITIAFTIIVNIVTYFALKKIDMIGSLKSVE